jgi:hypothetical protein
VFVVLFIDPNQLFSSDTNPEIKPVRQALVFARQPAKRSPPPQKPRFGDAIVFARCYSFRLMELTPEAIQRRIEELQLEHRDLDMAIRVLAETPGHDELQLRRMKKRKLLLKDQVAHLEAQLTPDVPA